MARRSAPEPVVYIEERSLKNFQRAQAEISKRGDGKELRKLLNKEIREATAPLVREMKQNAGSMNFKSSSNRSGQRAKRTAGTTKSGRVRKGKGLRQSLGAGIATEIDRGRFPGVRIRLKSKEPDVNALGKALNYQGRIRHPLFGNTDHWFVTNTTNGEGWFTKPAQRRHKEILGRVNKAVDKMLNDLAKDMGRGK
jgi:hypothetical protein